MRQEFVIGRNGNQPFKIAADGVSGNHAKIIIDETGWKLVDLESANGTYVRDEKGEYHRVFTKQIKENTVVRLGDGGHHSYVFMAHRLIAPEHDYAFEFEQLKKAWALQNEREAEQERINIRNGWIAKFAGVGAVILCGIIGMFTNVDPTTRYIAIAAAPIVVGLLFRNDHLKLKDIKSIKKSVIVCPNPHCRRPLSEFDVENMQCSACKAK